MGNQGRRFVSQTGLVIDYSAVTVDGILTPADAANNGIETNKHRVQLRQEVKTTYPQARGNALFSSGEFGPGQNFAEKRVTWLNVPANTTIEEITERLERLECPTLVRTLGLKPILTQDQKVAIEKGINTKSWEQYLEGFVRVEEGGPAVKYGDRLQYRAIHFSESFVEDNDNRMIDLKELQEAERQIAEEQGGATAIQMSAAQSMAPTIQPRAQVAPASL